MFDSHLPQLRQLFEDPRRLKHSEFIVVKASRSKEEERWSETRRTTEETVLEEEEEEIKAAGFNSTTQG